MTANANENPEQGISPANLFPLDAPEPVVCFQRNGRILRHVFRRLAFVDFEAFYANTITEGIAEGPDEDALTQAHAIYDTASLVLYERAIERVHGYQTRDGRAPETLPTWPRCVPLGHRLHAIGLLLNNRGTAAVDTLHLGAGGESASFVIERNEGECPTTKQCFGVTHRFRAPTADHRERFLCAVSKFPSSVRALVSLYDELVVFADGYSFNGAPVAPEQLQREMDTFHKLLASVALLTSFDVSEPDTRMAKAVAIATDLFGMETATPAMRGEVH